MLTDYLFWLNECYFWRLSLFFIYSTNQQKFQIGEIQWLQFLACTNLIPACRCWSWSRNSDLRLCGAGAVSKIYGSVTLTENRKKICKNSQKLPPRVLDPALRKMLATVRHRNQVDPKHWMEDLRNSTSYNPDRFLVQFRLWYRVPILVVPNIVISIISQSTRFVSLTLLFSVADSGSSAFLTPGYGIRILNPGWRKVQILNIS